MSSISVDATSLLQHAAARAVDPAATRERAAEAASAHAQPSRAEAGAAVREQVEAVLGRVSRKDTRLSFRVDDESGRTVIVVRDASTSEVLRQIPAEEMLRVARRLEAHLSESGDASGVLLADEA